MMLESVSENKNDNGNVIQEIYKDNSIEIIFNKIEKDQTFNSHRHKESQVVYLIDGEFDLVEDSKINPMKPGESRIIDCNIEHSAIAKTSFKSIDIKYNGQNEIVKTCCEYKKYSEVITKKIDLKHYFINTESNKVNLDENDLIILLGGSSLKVNGVTSDIKEMKIYRSKGERLIIEITDVGTELIILSKKI